MKLGVMFEQANNPITDFFRHSAVTLLSLLEIGRPWARLGEMW